MTHRKFAAALRAEVLPLLQRQGFEFDGNDTFRRIFDRQRIAHIIEFVLDPAAKPGKFSVRLAVWRKPAQRVPIAIEQLVAANCAQEDRLELKSIRPLGLHDLPLIGFLFDDKDRRWLLPETARQLREQLRDALYVLQNEGFVWFTQRAPRPRPRKLRSKAPSIEASELGAWLRNFAARASSKGLRRPRAASWLAMGELTIHGQTLCIGDAWSLPDTDAFIAVPPGNYGLSVLGLDYGDEPRIGRLRVLLDGASPDTRKKTARISVDVATAGVSDGDRMEDFWLSCSAEHSAWGDAFIERQCQHVDQAGFFACPPAGTTMAWCTTGFGDGTYPVWSLLQDERTVGIEVIFIVYEPKALSPLPAPFRRNPDPE